MKSLPLKPQVAEPSHFDESLLEQIAEYEEETEFILESRTQLKVLSKFLVEIREFERKALSRELHDRVGQNLTALSINLDVLRSRLAAYPEPEVIGTLEDCVALVDATADAIENILSELRLPMLHEQGLLTALKWHARNFSKRTDVAVKVQGDETMARLDPETEITLFRVAQEALNNVAKHAAATHVEIEFACSASEMLMRISDDGIGFDFDPDFDANSGAGFGLATMKERCLAVGGRLELRTVPKGGTQILVRVPR